MATEKKRFSKAEVKSWGLFLRETLQNPGAMGAIIPSSKQLAKQVAHQIPENGYVVELGAGTGVVTEALVQQGIAKDRIIIIERAAELVKYLKKQYPDMRVIHGDACELTHLLGEEAHHINAIISGLPLLSLPKATVDLLKQQLEAVLKPGSLFIQYTYRFRATQAPILPQLKLLHSKRIWINVPPARVEVFKYQ